MCASFSRSRRSLCSLFILWIFIQPIVHRNQSFTIQSILQYLKLQLGKYNILYNNRRSKKQNIQPHLRNSWWDYSYITSAGRWRKLKYFTEDPLLTTTLCLLQVDAICFGQKALLSPFCALVQPNIRGYCIHNLLRLNSMVMLTAGENDITINFPYQTLFFGGCAKYIGHCGKSLIPDTIISLMTSWISCCPQCTSSLIFDHFACGNKYIHKSVEQCQFSKITLESNPLIDSLHWFTLTTKTYQRVRSLLEGRIAS